VDPTVQRAYEVAKAIIEEAGHVDGVILICEIERNGVIVAFDDRGDSDVNDRLVDALRATADRIAGLRPDS
jgi:hypothetical protein